MLPPEKPATWADPMPRASSTAAASSAYVSTVAGPPAIAVRPEPRLSNAVSRYRSASPSSWNCHDSTVSPSLPMSGWSRSTGDGTVQGWTTPPTQAGPGSSGPARGGGAPDGPGPGSCTCDGQQAG